MVLPPPLIFKLKKIGPKNFYMKKKRNYRREYLRYYGNSLKEAAPEQKLHRAHKNNRNAARAKYGKIHGLSQAEMKGYDVDHKNKNPLDNSGGNLRLMSVKKNRGMCAVYKCK